MHFWSECNIFENGTPYFRILDRLTTAELFATPITQVHARNQLLPTTVKWWCVCPSDGSIREESILKPSSIDDDRHEQHLWSLVSKRRRLSNTLKEAILCFNGFINFWHYSHIALQNANLELCLVETQPCYVQKNILWKQGGRLLSKISSSWMTVFFTRSSKNLQHAQKFILRRENAPFRG